MKQIARLLLVLAIGVACYFSGKYNLQLPGEGQIMNPTFWQAFGVGVLLFIIAAILTCIVAVIIAFIVIGPKIFKK